MNLNGRKKILCDTRVVTAGNVAELLSNALVTHLSNSKECQYLYEYYKGKQPILGRVKEVRPEINNKIVENRANEIVAFKTGYLCGEPLQYVSRNGAEQASKGTRELNDLMGLCGKSARDREIAEWMYICGVGVRMVMPNSPYINREIIPKMQSGRVDLSGDEAPFEIYTLNPADAFVVYHSGLGEKPVMGVKITTKQDGSRAYSVYTESDYFELEDGGIAVMPKLIAHTARAAGDIPIVEYPLNSARLGAFETVIPILNAINTVQSNRIDGVEQFVQSLIVLTNVDVDEEAARQIQSGGFITLKSYGENKGGIEIIAEQLDQMQTQTLIDYMYQTVLNITGMPNRNGGNSTSDTGVAVVMRDGWESAEARAKSDEIMFEEAETRALRIVLRILRSTIGTDLKLSDIRVKFTRRNYENILSKSQVLTSMLANDKIAPVLAFTHCGLFSDPEEAAKMSDDYYNKVISQTLSEIDPATINAAHGDV